MTDQWTQDREDELRKIKARLQRSRRPDGQQNEQDQESLRERVETLRVQADNYKEVGKHGAALLCERQAVRRNEQLRKMETKDG